MWVEDKNGIYNSSGETISYPDEGNDACFEIEKYSPWFQYRNELINEYIKKHQLSGNFLDIGGGNGYQLKGLQESSYDGDLFMIEPGYKGCLNAKSRKLENLYCGVFQDFDFQEHNIKVCGLFDVVEHIEDDISFLNDLYDKMLPGTSALINVPALNFLWSSADVNAGHFRRYKKKDLKRIERLTKFSVLDSGYYFSFYFLPLFLLRSLPFRLFIRKNSEQSLESESKNHERKAGIVQNHIDSRHKKWLKGISKSKTAPIGTSLFFILRKE